MPQSLKVSEGSLKGNVKGKHITIELPQSVKVREGSVKSDVKEQISAALIVVSVTSPTCHKALDCFGITITRD